MARMVTEDTFSALIIAKITAIELGNGGQYKLSNLLYPNLDIESACCPIKPPEHLYHALKRYPTPTCIL